MPLAARSETIRTNPKVYIIILNWNGLQDTCECLESVFKFNYENFEVVVVDNGSSDDSIAAIRRSYPQIVLLENRENLYTGGNNLGRGANFAEKRNIFFRESRLVLGIYVKVGKKEVENRGNEGIM